MWRSWSTALRAQTTSTPSTATSVIEMNRTTEPATEPVTEPAVQAASLLVFVEDTAVPVLGSTSVAAKLAQSVAVLKRPFGDPSQVMAKLNLPPEKGVLQTASGSYYQARTDKHSGALIAPKAFDPGSQVRSFTTEEGEIFLILILKPGT